MNKLRIPRDLSDAKDAAVDRFQMHRQMIDKQKNTHDLIDAIKGHFIRGSNMTEDEIKKCMDMITNVQARHEEMQQMLAQIIDYDSLIISVIEAYLLQLEADVPVASGTDDAGNKVPNRVLHLKATSDAEGVTVNISDIWAFRLMNKVFGPINPSNFKVNESQG